jgi:E3 ubiquitin-protein ligase DOA10
MNTTPGILTTTLAIGDGLQITFFVITSLITVVALVLGFTANRVAARYDRLEDELNKKAEDSIEQRFKLLREQFLGKMELIRQDIKRANERLKSGDRLLGELRDRDHRDELKTLTAIEQLRRDVIEHMATKAELARVEKAQRQIESKVAQIQGAA